jgi:sirohydrochlorin cobaltochelatase
LKIEQKIEERFEGTPLKICFTSNIIRNIWKKRRVESDKWEAMGVSSKVINVKGVLGTIGDLHEEGIKNIVVQPTLLFHGEQYCDLQSYINGFNSIVTVKKRWMPFSEVALGRPVLGTYGAGVDYKKDVEEVIETLKSDIELANSQNASLVYVAHGNEFLSSGVFLELESRLNRINPRVKVVIGMVEGFPDFDDIKERLLNITTSKVILKPLMICAGDHAHNDLNSDSPDSWRSLLSQLGFEVDVLMKGLGDYDDFAEIFPRRISSMLSDLNL